MAKSGEDPAEGSRETIDRELRRSGKDPAERTGDHPEDPEAAAQATQDNDLTTGHSRPGDGGSDNSKNKS